MLTAMRNSWLLFTLLALIVLASAINIDQALHIDGIEAYLQQGIKRQAPGTGSSADSTPTPSEQPSSNNNNAPTSTPPPSDQPTDAPKSTPPPPSDRPQTSNAPQSSNPAPNPAPNSTPVSTPPPSKASTPVVRTSALVATSVQPFTTVFTTISDGQTNLVTSTGESTAVLTTGTAVSTELPLPNGGNGGGSGGLTDTNKKIIGGVVGGVGGAILLGGIAVVCWRIWGRKKRVAEDDDDLMGGTGSALGDKPPSASTANSPFQSNLDQYHTPGGRPNAAANF